MPIDHACFVFVLAVQRNTERRSQASNGPYVCDVVCSPSAGGISGASCLSCIQAQSTPKVSPKPASCPFAYRGYCYSSPVHVDRAKSNYERSQNVKCYLLGFCPPAVEQPTPLGSCPYTYGGHCYSSAEDAEDAEYLATKGPLDPPVEAPDPIDN